MHSGPPLIYSSDILPQFPQNMLQHLQHRYPVTLYTNLPTIFVNFSRHILYILLSCSPTNHYIFLSSIATKRKPKEDSTSYRIGMQEMTVRISMIIIRCTVLNRTHFFMYFLLEYTALLVQPQYWKDSQPLEKIKGWRGRQSGGWMCLSLCINRGP